MQKLYDAFPRLYRGRDLPLQASLMSQGFCCGDGWFELIWNLSKDIEQIAYNEGRNPAADTWPEATQVKEKFGSLRFHLRFNTCSAPMRTLLESARDASEHICEECGQPGTPVQQHHGIQALCPHHAQ
ncbi:MAG TPA: hypothetical protein VJ654_10995 [Noviherbaspirillum sp.]|nr:hypothetical protein [Noviherbaspirillum sp.]